MKISYSWILILASIFAGCSPEQSTQDGPQMSFRSIVTELKDKAAKKNTAGLTITVTDQTTADARPAEPVTRLIQVRKLSPGGVPGNERKTAEIIDVYFVYETGRWRCAKAQSKEFEGDKIVGQNSLEGPDIRLANLLIWIGL